MRRRVRSHRAIVSMLCATGIVFVAGCSAGATARPPTPSPTREPAGAAGGACLHLDYDVIESTLGAVFDVAAKGDSAGTSTCVLQRDGASLPDLTLAVTRSSADPTVFKAVVMPKGAASVAELGRQAYSVPVAATAEAGPGVEVGWLSGNARLMVMRYRFPIGTDDATAAAFTPKLVELTRKIDRANV